MTYRELYHLLTEIGEEQFDSEIFLESEQSIATVTTGRFTNNWYQAKGSGDLLNQIEYDALNDNEKSVFTKVHSEGDIRFQWKE